MTCIGLLAATLSFATPAAVVAQAPTVGNVPAGFEVSPEPSPSWGVTTLLPSPTVELRSLVWDFAEVDGVVYVAGRFGHVRQFVNSPLHDQAYLAAFDSATGEWIPSFSPQLDGAVFALETDGSRLFVGGEFTSINGVATGPLAALDPSTGSVVAGFTANLSFSTGVPVVMDMDIANDSLYAGGNFDFADSDRALRLAKLDLSTGAHDTAFGGAASGARVWTIEASPSGDRLYVGGFFEVLNGEPHKWFGALDGFTGELVPGVNQGTPVGMPNCCKQNPFDIAVHGDKVYVARESHLLEILNASDLSRVGYYLASYGGGDYQATEVIGNRLYTGGHFWANQAFSTEVVPFNNTAWQAANQSALTDPSQTHVVWSAAFDADSGEEIPGYLMDLGMQSGIWAIHGSENGRLWLGGDITRAGSRWAGGFAVFDVVEQPEKGPLLSLGRPVTMSSVRDNLDGSYAVDLHLAGRTRHDGVRTFFAETQVENDPWLEIDLGSVQQIGQVRLFERGDGNINGLSNGSLFVSDQPFSSTDPAATRTQPGVGTIDVGAIGRWTDVDVYRTGRFVRYQLPGSNRQLTADSIEIFEQIGAAPTLPAPSLRVTRTEKKLVVLNYGLVDGAESYQILRDDVVIGTDNDRWYVDSDVVEGTTYTYSVRAVDARGVPGDESLTVETTTPGSSIGTPEFLNVTRIEKRLVVLNFGTIQGAETHQILRDGVVVGTSSSGWFVDSGLAEGTTYTHTVRAVAGNGQSGPETDPATTTTLGGTQAAPAFVNITRTERRLMVINYATVEGAATHEMLLDGAVVATDNNRWHVFADLEPSTSYELAVRAVDANGVRGPITSVTGITLP